MTDKYLPKTIAELETEFKEVLEKTTRYYHADAEDYWEEIDKGFKELKELFYNILKRIN